MSSATVNAPVGLDKLAFFLSASEAEFSPRFDCDVQPARFNAATGEAAREAVLWRSTAGNPIWGTRATVNTNDYQLTIHPDRETGSPVIELQFSAGAFSNSNFEPLDRDRTAFIAARVERELRERGIRLPLDTATLTRLDIARNIALDEPVSSYAPVFSGAGAQKRTRKQDFGGTGFLVYNSQWELCLYDKAEEMKSRGYELELRPTNTLRPELRLLKGRVVRDRLGMTDKTLPALLERWSALQPAHEQSLRKHLLCWSHEVSKPALSDLLGAVEHTSGARYHLDAFLKLNGTANLVRELGLPAAKCFLDEHFPANDKQKRDRNRELHAAALRIALDGDAPSGRSLRDLYRELETKLITPERAALN